LQREQEGIRSKLAMENRGLSWDDTRQMPFTNRVYIIAIFSINQ